MALAKEDVGFYWHLGKQVIPQNSQPTTAIKDEAFLPDTHFDTRGISSIAYRLFPWSGNLTSNAPKLDNKISSEASYHVGSSIKCAWIRCRWIKIWHFSIKLTLINNALHRRLSTQ
jgi:hypothetical protein